jgi:serine/threonine protein kinase
MAKNVYTDLTGKQLGNYQIIAEIGHGGMGTVYRAYDPRLQREVAIKVLRPELTSENEVVQRFQREAVTAANLRHPSIVVVHDVGTAEGYQYIVMELLLGRTLTHEVQEHGAIPLHRATHLLGQLASALDYAHQRGLIHRDVKSSNVIVGRDDHVTLTDFGLVKALEGQTGGGLTQAGMALGTLNYMSPEQVAGTPIDRRADIYALGVLAFEMLTGKLPFESESPYQTITAIMQTPPPSLLRLNPMLDAGVEAVLHRALAKRPEERFQTAGELAQALRRLRAPAGLQLVSSGGQNIPLRAAGTSLGRVPDNDIALRDNEVSRYHARIYCEAAGWFITDLGSTNGTFVNERRLTPRAAYPLAPGDTLRLGSTTVFQVVEAGASPMAEAKTTSLS